MKILFIVFLLLLSLFSIAQIYISLSTSKTENQPYTVVKVEKDFEIRHYPSVNIATIHSSAKTFKDLGSGGFRKLAGYIFGGNEANQQISMTSPVHMVISDTESTMSFVMPSAYKEKGLPKPNNGEVILSTTKDEYVAAIRFGGFGSDKKIEDHSTILREALKAQHINYNGNFTYLGYNPPYQLFGRRNEVIVTVDWPTL
jgi:hypothetical protein